MNDPGPIPFPDEFLLNAYRDRTISMLRRYARAAVELGRLPSLLGREFFRARVTSYTVHTFEDAIIFAFDMERSLEELTPLERVIIGRLVLQEYTQHEVARMLHIGQSTVQRRYFDALDHLTEILLQNSLLNASIIEPRYRRRTMAPVLTISQPEPSSSHNGTESVQNGERGSLDLKACQEPENSNFVASA
jgi:Sigma-70, region 4